MRQEIAASGQGGSKTRGMAILEERLGRPVRDVIQERYVEGGESMETVAAALGIDTSTLSRWMVRLSIPARVFASDRPESAA
jgi:transposase-like protein